MEITKEFLQSIYSRAIQYCVARYGKEPYTLEIMEDGALEVEYVEYWGGEADSIKYEIDLACLSQDLELAYTERKKEEEEKRLKYEAEQAERIRRREEQEAKQRRAQYEALKKEFES